MSQAGGKMIYVFLKLCYHFGNVGL